PFGGSQARPVEFGMAKPLGVADAPVNAGVERVPTLVGRCRVDASVIATREEQRSARVVALIGPVVAAPDRPAPCLKAVRRECLGSVPTWGPDHQRVSVASVGA